jgi:hypothetical protein
MVQSFAAGRLSVSGASADIQRLLQLAGVESPADLPREEE